MNDGMNGWSMWGFGHGLGWLVWIVLIILILVLIFRSGSK